MYNNKKISLVIPCYNEERGLEAVLQNKPSFIDEVIIIDNDSNDKTADVAKRCRATIIHEKERGYGRAYQAGLPKAKGDIIVMLDGDNSYSLPEAERLLSHMKTRQCDFVSGCRYPLINKNAQPLIKTPDYF